MRNKVKIWLIVLAGGLAILSPGIVSGQVEQPARYEVELKDSENYFNVISAEEYGLILTREIRGSYSKGKVGWEMIYLDTLLNEVWKNEYPIDFFVYISGLVHH